MPKEIDEKSKYLYLTFSIGFFPKFGLKQEVGVGKKWIFLKT